MIGSLDRAACFPGETLLLNVHVQNQSKKDMSGLKAYFVKSEQYLAKKKIKNLTSVNATIEGR